MELFLSSVGQFSVFQLSNLVSITSLLIQISLTALIIVI